MAKKIIGRFYFKKTVNGNLQGEYSNDHTDQSYTESAIRINLNNDEPKNHKEFDYSGVYNTSWVESEKFQCFSARLEIIAKPSCLNIFSLKWSKKTNEVLFEGEAMLCDNILIGNYCSN